jgi:hypothetical protein
MGLYGILVESLSLKKSLKELRLSLKNSLKKLRLGRVFGAKKNIDVPA